MSAAIVLRLVVLLAMVPKAEPATAYSCIRVVREEAGTPAKPEIVFPQGYALHTETNYEVASPGEYYVFMKGPKGVARDVRIRWPGLRIKAVIQGKTSLTLRRNGETEVACDIPVTADSLRSAWPTLEVHSNFPEEALSIRIEHNDPNRRAGYYATHSWVACQTKACVNFIFAARQILRDWGIHREIAGAKLGRISLMGFESNNPLHGDSPPHWHLIYYWPKEPGSQVPHFHMDEKGRIISNSIAIMEAPEKNRLIKAGEPMIYTDPDGRVRLVAQIRSDGGLDLGPAESQWTYSIVAGDENDDFTDSVRVLRGGKPWIRVATQDDVAQGILTVRIEPLNGRGEPAVERYSYDPLNGVSRKADK